MSGNPDDPVLVTEERNSVALVYRDLLAIEEVFQFRLGHTEWRESIAGPPITQGEGKRDPIGVRPLEESIFLIR